MNPFTSPAARGLECPGGDVASTSPNLSARPDVAWSLPVERAEPRATFDLLAGGKAAFARILQRIGRRSGSIQIRCFEWRDDETGEMVARALLGAADRGVEITILKDRVGMAYEHLEGSKQSFFHKRIGLIPRLQTWSLMTVYGRWGSLRQKPTPLADALLNHQIVTVHRHEKRFDHAKLYVFDDETVILGGMGIGDDFRAPQRRLHGRDLGRPGRRPAGRALRGRALFDPERPLRLPAAFVSGQRVAPGVAGRSTAGADRQRAERLTIAMAYFGDQACTEALVDAVKRGVFVTLLTAARANIIGDLNL